MVGLFEKDFRLLMQRKQLLILFFIIVVILGFSQESTFILGYLPFCTVIVTVSTIAYDELDHGYEFLMTLPITTKSYVTEKYLFCISGAGISWLIAIFLYVISNYIHGNARSFSTEFPVIFVYLPIALIMLSILIPFQLKYGVEKSRIILVTLAGAVFAAGYFSINLIDKNSILLNTINSISDKKAEIILFTFGILITLISYCASNQIMEKKEF